MPLKLSKINRYNQATINTYILDSHISSAFNSEKYKEEAKKANQKIETEYLKYAQLYNNLND
ncbi:MAG: hypothetical protein LUG46_06520 [Erysipelotrichaceae bacterium]|nr:hypothetical protein [Erysipelotrichaceae bacterium]